MRKTIVVFGLISGAVSSAMLLLTVPFMERIGFDRGEVLGYTTIVASFLLVYFGIRSYRDRVAGGTMTFGRGFTVGILITLVSSACYVATWEFIYFRLNPGFADQYAAHAIERARASGASQQEIEATTRQLEQFKVQYQNPLINTAITFMEPFPIGLVVTLISAAILRRARQEEATGAAGQRVS
jgi:hypothetical protein